MDSLKHIHQAASAEILMEVLSLAPSAWLAGRSHAPHFYGWPLSRLGRLPRRGPCRPRLRRVPRS
jgi:hypothetical protein